VAAALALAAKDLRLLLRSKSDLFFAFGFPVMMAVFFGLMFSGGGGDAAALRIAVHDDDASPESKAFVEALEAGPELEVLRTSTAEEAADLVRRGKRVASVVVVAGFGEAATHPLAGTPARLRVGADPARRADAGILAGVLAKYAFDRIGGRFPAPAPGSTSGRLEPFVIEPENLAVMHAGPANAFEVSFPQGIVWGIMGAAAAFGISLVSERTHGTLLRLRTGPVSPMTILFGKGLACFATTTAVAVLLMALGVAVFDVRPDSVLALAAAILSCSVGFVGLMMLLASIGRTESAAGGMGWAILVVLAMFGGAMVPLSFMPGWMQSVSHASLVKWAILSLEGAIWRDFSALDMLLPCAVLIGVGIVGFVVGSIVFRRAA
jgi:ABC-2 type transport system permease protein